MVFFSNGIAVTNLIIDFSCFYFYILNIDIFHCRILRNFVSLKLFTFLCTINLTNSFFCFFQTLLFNTFYIHIPNSDLYSIHFHTNHTYIKNLHRTTSFFTNFLIFNTIQIHLFTSMILAFTWIVSFFMFLRFATLSRHCTRSWNSNRSSIVTESCRGTERINREIPRFVPAVDFTLLAS